MPDPARFSLAGGGSASPETMRRQVIRITVNTEDESFVLAIPRPAWTRLVGGHGYEVLGWIEATGWADDGGGFDLG